MQSNSGNYILFGDTNKVRNAQEQHGSIFSRSEAEPDSFKIFHSWFKREGFDELINSELSNSSSLLSHDKLKALKSKIRLWHNTLRSKEISRKQDAIKSLKILEDKIDAGYASTEDRDSRINILHEIDKLDNLEAMDSIQKAHIK
ncbi:hypothetical protein Tco_1009523 [Tanacetum coccineum]